MFFMCDDLTYPQYFELFSVERMEISSKRRRTLISPDTSNDDSSGDEQPPVATETLRDRYGNFLYRKATANVSRIQYMSPGGGE